MNTRFWEGEMIKDLKNNKKIVIPSISASNLNILYNKLVGLFPEINILKYIQVIPIQKSRWKTQKMW